ncbi:Zinc-binding alcohol dehydrogenase domain-containing protein cipB 3 [Colletotrichum chlorophyti]|uniref:Zinc-binding alcohol dehydrogenase domain-containing protein cipB 3 n=1 Tax=Colletotrichum chlorophyti TaxID=708187 RepID=A0A1Q8S8Q0_9PEZI|nr:Zinc-binding alcohol dehydrogenase domain-containing protein cipB 3 [Colletotrichum chlorophyti]
MTHLAAVIPEAKAPLVVKEVDTPQPGPNEVLIKNELIALAPIDAKIAKLGIFPIKYPGILGGAYGGTVAAVGAGVTSLKVGDKVAASKSLSSGDNHAAFQQYVLSRDVTASKVPDGSDLHGPVGLIGNFTTVLGLFNAYAGLERPDLSGKAPSRGKKVLVYGGTSSFGSLAVQYAAQAGYDVVTTTSPRHKELTSNLGAVRVVDHTQGHDAVLKELLAEGPYELVVDSISLPQTFAITGDVLAAQGGGEIYALLPAFEPGKFPKGVTAKFESWSVVLQDEEHAELLKWGFGTYFPKAVAEDKLVSLPVQKVGGGLGGLNEAIDILIKGVSGVKVVVHPWE